MEIGEGSDGSMSKLLRDFTTLVKFFFYSVVSVGPMPRHIVFIMDGNRTYSKKKNLNLEIGYRTGFWTLMSLLKHCYELGVKYVTVYAFSIDNLKTKPEEIKIVMDLMLEKIESLLKEESIVNHYGVRVYFIGNLKLLNEQVRIAAEKAMNSTANNTNVVLLICVAYSSSDEIVHSIQESCEYRHEYRKSSKEKKIEEECEVKLVDLEKHMYMAVAPEPDILIRSSGQTRLSNFLVWHTKDCLLFFPKALWPEIGLWHLVWAILNYQRNFSYLEKKKKQI